MFRYSDFNELEDISKLALTIPHKIITMEEAVIEYKQGKTVGIIDGFRDNNTARVILMDNKSTFTADFDYLVNCKWVVFNNE